MKCHIFIYGPRIWTSVHDTNFEIAYICTLFRVVLVVARVVVPLIND